MGEIGRRGAGRWGGGGTDSEERKGLEREGREGGGGRGFCAFPVNQYY